MSWIRSACRGGGRWIASLLSEKTDASSSRVNMFATLTLASILIWWLLTRLDRFFEIHKTYPDDMVVVIAGIITALVTGGVGGYVMNRMSSRGESTTEPLPQEGMASPEESTEIENTETSK